MTDFAAWGQSKGSRGSILYLALSDWDCGSDFASAYKGPCRFISRKGPSGPKGSSIVPLGRKKPDYFSVDTSNFFLFMHQHSFHSCSWWKTREVVFPEARGTGRWLVLVPGTFLLAAVFACRHRRRNTSHCLLSEEVLLQMMVVHCIRFMFWVVSGERWSQTFTWWLSHLLFMMCTQSSVITLQKLLSVLNFCGFTFLTEFCQINLF